MLDRLRPRLEGKQAVLIGVGNPLRGDDGLGPVLVQELQGRVGATLIDAGDVPENYLGVVASAGPDVVVIVDAAELGASPGDLALMEVDELDGTSLSTHNASLRLFVQVLLSEVQADVFVLGVQPASTGFGAPISPMVGATIDLLQRVFAGCWPTNARPAPADEAGEDATQIP